MASWKRQPKRGRKSEAERNALINALAELFHEKSGWEQRYKADSDLYLREYRAGLRCFLVFILATDDIAFPVQLGSRLQYVDPRYHEPRDK